MSAAEARKRAASLPGRETHKGRSGFKRFAQVALPVPLFQTFTYGVPDSIETIEPGCRVWTRFGSRILMGCVVELYHELPKLPPGTKLQPVLEVRDEEPVLGPQTPGSRPMDSQTTMSLRQERSFIPCSPPRRHGPRPFGTYEPKRPERLG